MAEARAPAKGRRKLVWLGGSIFDWSSLIITIVGLALAAWVGKLGKDSDYFPTYLFMSLVVQGAFLAHIIFLHREAKSDRSENARLDAESQQLRIAISETGASHPSLIDAMAEFQHEISQILIGILGSDSISDDHRQRLTKRCNDALSKFFVVLADASRMIVALQHSARPNAVRAKLRLIHPNSRDIPYKTIARSKNDEAKNTPEKRDDSKIHRHYIYTKLKDPGHNDKLFNSTNHEIDELIGDQRHAFLKPTYVPHDNYSVMVAPIYGPQSTVNGVDLFGKRAQIKYTNGDVLIGFVHLYANDFRFDLNSDKNMIRSCARVAFFAAALAESVKLKIQNSGGV